MPEDQPQTREPKICLNCGTENEWHHGQCISCGRTNFLTPQQYAANRRSSRTDILSGIFLLGISFYFLSISKDRLFTEKWTLLMVAVLFFVSIGSLVNSIYKYRHAKNILIWHITVFILYVLVVLWQFF